MIVLGGGAASFSPELCNLRVRRSALPLSLPLSLALSLALGLALALTLTPTLTRTLTMAPTLALALPLALAPALTLAGLRRLCGLVGIIDRDLEHGLCVHASVSGCVCVCVCVGV